MVTSLTREDMLGEWDGWVRKIVEVGKVESSRAPVARLLALLEQSPEEVTQEEGESFSFYVCNLPLHAFPNCTDYKDFIMIKLVMKLIFNKGMKGIFFKHFEVSERIFVHSNLISRPFGLMLVTKAHTGSHSGGNLRLIIDCNFKENFTVTSNPFPPSVELNYRKLV